MHLWLHYCKYVSIFFIYCTRTYPTCVYCCKKNHRMFVNNKINVRNCSLVLKNSIFLMDKTRTCGLPLEYRYSGLVYRGEGSVPDNFEDKYTAGREFTFWGFTSTTVNSEVVGPGFLVSSGKQCYTSYPTIVMIVEGKLSQIKFQFTGCHSIRCFQHFKRRV